MNLLEVEGVLRAGVEDERLGGVGESLEGPMASSAAVTKEGHEPLAEEPASWAAVAGVVAPAAVPRDGVVIVRGLDSSVAVAGRGPAVESSPSVEVSF